MPPAVTDQIEELASRVMADIRNRGLVSGDRYLTAAEVRDNLRAGKNAVNDALKLLADRNVLIRRQRAGTFIGPRFSVNREVLQDLPLLQTVHVLMPMDYYRSNIIPGRVFVDQVSSAIPGVSVQLHHIVDEQATQYTLKLVDQLVSTGQREGLVLVRSSQKAQRAVQSSGLPAVVFGSTYPDIGRLSSLDPDQYQAGRLAAQTSLARGHERFAVIMRNTWRRGDNLFMEGFSAVLGQAGVGVDRVRVLSTPEDAAVIEHDVGRLFSEAPHPTAIICRSRLHAEAALRGIRDYGLEPGRDVMVICLQTYPCSEDREMLSIIPTLDIATQVRRVAELLSQVAMHGQSEARVNLVPVKLSGSGTESLEARA